MANKKSVKSLEVTRRSGYSFVIHWALGLALFFIIPLGKSLWYSFNNVVIEPGKIMTEYVGVEYYVNLLTKDASYLDNLRSSIGMMLYLLPFIISLSLILAVLLNQQFKGRTIFRAIFFLPAIISNSVVMNALNSDYIRLNKCCRL